MEGSLSLVAVYAAVRLIADSIATLPLQAYRRTSTGRESEPLPKILAAPSAYGTRIDWVQRALVSLLLRGNAYGLKVGFDPQTSGYSSVEWLNPDQVRFDDSSKVWTYLGREVEEARMLHVPGLVLPGSRLGVSPIAACRTSVEGGNAAQDFMRSWYRNRAIPGLLFKNSERTLAAEVADAAKDRLTATLHAGEPFVTGKDWTLEPIKLTADDAGFVTAARLNATQVATIFGIPPEMIGGETGSALTYSTVELNQIQFLTNTLRPWTTRLEAAFSDLLPQPRYVRFNVDALLRVDAKTRHEIYQLDRNIGLRNIDEIRALEDEEPLPDGKGQDYTPLARMGTSPKEEAR